MPTTKTKPRNSDDSQGHYMRDVIRRLMVAGDSERCALARGER
jgi:hypothetical protein